MNDPSVILSSLVGHFLESPLDGGLIKDLLLDSNSTPDIEPSLPLPSTTSTSASLSSINNTQTSDSHTNSSDGIDLTTVSPAALGVLHAFGAKAAAFAVNIKPYVISRHAPPPPSASQVYASVMAASSPSSPFIIDINMVDSVGSSQLHYAVRANRLDLVTRLLQHKADSLRYDHYGYTPVDWCLYLDHNVNILRAMLATNAAIVHHTNQWRSTPLFLAARYASVDAVRALLAAGANGEHCNLYGDTSLHYAADRCRLDVIKCLIEDAKCDIKHTNHTGGVALKELLESCQKHVIGVRAKGEAKAEVIAWLTRLTPPPVLPSELLAYTVPMSSTPSASPTSDATTATTEATTASSTTQTSD